MKMPALPSFVELMASLGLENETCDCGSASDRSPHCPLHLHSPSTSASHGHGRVPSLSGPASYKSPPTSPPQRDAALYWETDSERSETTRHRVGRYAPYSPRISQQVRRQSVPPPSSDDLEHEHLVRPFSTSPYHSPPLAPIRARPPTIRLQESHRSSTARSQMIANTPISTFVRRRTPQTSPTSPTFAHRRETSDDPPAPVSLPSLPPLLSTPYTFPAVSTADNGANISRPQLVSSPVPAWRSYVPSRGSSNGLIFNEHRSIAPIA